ncbi:hypothetical protein BGX38DRAFT_1273943 [Terfezia claveryi]|nr:hypothetical protein BGX38DRAFT_1273943 [Terfezia claveryi]
MACETKCPWPTLTIAVTNTSRVEHNWHIFTEPPKIDGSAENVFIQSIQSAKIPSLQSHDFVLPRATFAVTAGGNPWWPEFPDFYGPIQVATPTTNGTTIKMTVKNDRAQFDPPPTFNTTSPGAFTVQTDDSFDQGSGYVVGVALPDLRERKVITATTTANPMANIQISEVLNLWICWGDFEQGKGIKAHELIQQVYRHGVIAKVSFTEGRDRIEVSYLANGHYEGEGVTELPRPN